MSDHSERLYAYKAGAFNEIKGWVGDKMPDLLGVICDFHHDHGVRGDAMEIGVFQGRFFLALESVISDDEIAVAVDLFNDQNLSVDNNTYGSGLLEIFSNNIEKYATRSGTVHIVSADSMTFRPSTAMDISKNNGFRLISVDGGHTAEHVMNDLFIASDIVVGGGAILLDDWMSPHWPGVHEGYNRFMSCMNRNLAPVIFSDNKLILTTLSHARSMIEYVRDKFSPLTEQTVKDVSSHGFAFLAAA